MFRYVWSIFLSTIPREGPYPACFVTRLGLISLDLRAIPSTVRNICLPIRCKSFLRLFLTHPRRILTHGHSGPKRAPAFCGLAGCILTFPIHLPCPFLVAFSSSHFHFVSYSPLILLTRLLARPNNGRTDYREDDRKDYSRDTDATDHFDLPHHTA